MTDASFADLLEVEFLDRWFEGLNRMTGFLERLKKGLAKTAQLFNIRSWFGRKVDQSFLDDLESRLIQADVGVAATTRIIERVARPTRKRPRTKTSSKFVKDELKGLLEDPKAGPFESPPNRRLFT